MREHYLNAFLARNSLCKNTSSSFDINTCKVVINENFTDNTTFKQLKDYVLDVLDKIKVNQDADIKSAKNEGMLELIELVNAELKPILDLQNKNSYTHKAHDLVTCFKKTGI